MAPIDDVEDQSPEEEMQENTIMLQIQQFLDEWHYRIIKSSVCKNWGRHEGMVAALQLLETQGLTFAEGEIEHVSSLEEHELIRVLLTKMSPDFRKDWERTAQQIIRLLVQAAAVRNVIDKGSTDDIQKAMNKPDKSGLLECILNGAIVQATQEVAEIHSCHASWVQNTSVRVDRLCRSADDALQAQSQLRALQAQLDAFGGSQNEKSKKVLMNVASGNDKALTQTVFASWMGHCIKMKAEKDIRDKFEAEIAHLDNLLMTYRQSQMNNVRNVLMRKAAEGDGNLLIQVWKAWVDEVAETKRECGSQDEMRKIEEKMAGFAAAQAENTKKVMTRMSAGSDGALLTVVMGAWKEWLVDYKKNKDMEDAVKEQELKMQEYLKKKKDNAAGILDKMNAATDSGLVEHVVSSWCQMYNDNKKAAEMERIMIEQQEKFAALNGRQKDNAKGVMQRVNEMNALNLMLKHFAQWALDAKLERSIRFYNKKIDSKKDQLQSVQSLFKNFASQLDQGIGKEEKDSGSGGGLPAIARK